MLDPAVDFGPEIQDETGRVGHISGMGRGSGRARF